jgi:hypothetical protein
VRKKERRIRLAMKRFMKLRSPPENEKAMSLRFVSISFPLDGERPG